MDWSVLHLKQHTTLALPNPGHDSQQSVNDCERYIFYHPRSVQLQLPKIEQSADLQASNPWEDLASMFYNEVSMEHQRSVNGV
jgi:hypothetical protein